MRNIYDTSMYRDMMTSDNRIITVMSGKHNSVEYIICICVLLNRAQT